MPERGSTRHSARVDEELGGEVESLVRGAPVEARADEFRQMEHAAQGEPAPDAFIVEDDVELRSLLAISLRPSAFPASRARLLEVAREEHAEDRILEQLEQLESLPDGPEYENVQQVWEALGGGHESRDATSFDGSLAHDAPVTTAAPIRVDDSSNDSSTRVGATGLGPAAKAAPAEAPGGTSLLGRVAGIAIGGSALVAGATLGVARTILRRKH